MSELINADNFINNKCIELIDINKLDKDRIIEIWKKCSKGKYFEYKEEYGIENVYEDVLYAYNKNPWFVMFIIISYLNEDEKKIIKINEWQDYIEMTITKELNKKLLSIKDCIKKFEESRDYNNKNKKINEEKIVQNIKFKQHIEKKLWKSLYILYKKLNYSNETFEHIEIPLNIAEIKKYETIWIYLQRLENVDNIPSTFWKWLSEEKLKTHLTKYYSNENLNKSKEELIELLYNTQHIQQKYENNVSILNNGIRTLNESIKPIITDHITNKCAIFECIDDIQKIYNVNECIELLKKYNIEIKKEEYFESDINQKLYYCIYYHNIKKFIKNKKISIQKKIIESLLLCKNLLNFGDHSDYNKLHESEMIETLNDFILPSNITDNWFINVFREFTNVENSYNLYWKFYKHSNNFSNSNDCSILYDWKRRFNSFETLNNIAYNIFTHDKIKNIIIKISSERKSTYMTPSTFSLLLKHMIEHSSSIERCLDIMYRILYEDVSLCCILYRFTINLINDNEIVEI